MTPYTKEYYAKYHEGALKSARVILPIVFELAKIKSIIDVGCGSGAWLDEVSTKHLDVLCAGIDESDHALDIAKEKSLYVARKTTEDLPTNFPTKYDLCLCLEVAEHIPMDQADALIDKLCSLSDLVLFSAAIPFQGGDGHVNEQWQGYWIEKFAEKGYRAIDCIRPVVWKNSEVAPWYRQNCFLFAKGGAIAITDPLCQPLPDIASLVHPVLWQNAHNMGQQTAANRKTCVVAIPMGAGTISHRCFDTAFATWASQDPNLGIVLQTRNSSSLTSNFNGLWCMALNRKPRPDYFAMCHADVVPESGWVSKMIQLMEAAGLEMLSTVVRFKNDSGMTSTALSTDDDWNSRRLVMKEVCTLPHVFDVTAACDHLGTRRQSKFGIPYQLLCNTGLFVCRFDHDWVEQVHFEFKNRIRFDEANGEWIDEFQPEDWLFSRQLYELGVPYGATWAVQATHVGDADYKNDAPYGHLVTDPLA